MGLTLAAELGSQCSTSYLCSRSKQKRLTLVRMRVTVMAIQSSLEKGWRNWKGLGGSSTLRIMAPTPVSLATGREKGHRHHQSFKMRPRISIRGSVRWSVRPRVFVNEELSDFEHEKASCNFLNSNLISPGVLVLLSKRNVSINEDSMIKDERLT